MYLIICLQLQLHKNEEILNGKLCAVLSLMFIIYVHQQFLMIHLRSHPEVFRSSPP